jgi:hypothetical protein
MSVEIYDNYIKKLDEIYKYISDLSMIALNNVDDINKIEGNYFSFNIDDKIDTTNKYKQATLYYSSFNAVLNICEIGFNAGFSSLLILLSRKKIKSTNLLIFDIGTHKYVKPCLEYLRQNFENEDENIKTTIKYIEGNSIITAPEYINSNPSLIGTFDLIHVDGGHTYECIINDMKNADILLKINGIIVIDDTNVNYIYETVNNYILSEKYIEIFILDLSKCISPHRIIKKIE